MAQPGSDSQWQATNPSLFNGGSTERNSCSGHWFDSMNVKCSGLASSECKGTPSNAGAPGSTPGATKRAMQACKPQLFKWLERAPCAQQAWRGGRLDTSEKRRCHVHSRRGAEGDWTHARIEGEGKHLPLMSSPPERSSGKMPERSSRPGAHPQSDAVAHNPKRSPHPRVYSRGNEASKAMLLNPKVSSTPPTGRRKCSRWMVA